VLVGGGGSVGGGGTGVFVGGGTGVFVGETGVSVGWTGVSVGGRGVFVGRIDVLVEVAVGGMGVFVRVGKGVLLGVEVLVGVLVGVRVGVHVEVGVKVAVAGGLNRLVLVGKMGRRVGVLVGVPVSVGVMVNVKVNNEPAVGWPARGCKVKVAGSAVGETVEVNTNLANSALVSALSVLIVAVGDPFAEFGITRSGSYKT